MKQSLSPVSRNADQLLSILLGGLLIVANPSLAAVAAADPSLAGSAGAMPAAVDSTQGASTQGASSREKIPSRKNVSAKNSSSQRVLLSGTPATAGIELVEDAGTNLLLITSPKLSSANYKVERLSNPERLVIDLPQGLLLENQTISASDTEMLKNVRIGAHPEKTRIVLDLKSKQTQHTSLVENGVLAIELTDESDDSASIRPVKAEVAPKSKDTQNSSAKESVAIVQSQAAKPALELANVISGLSVENVGTGQNMLVVSLKDSSSYKLSKTSPSEYVLTVPGAKLDPRAGLTIVSPPGSGAVRSVRPFERTDGVTLRIFSDPNSELLARAASNKLVVAAAAKPVVDPLTSRAQMAPESKKSEGKKEEAAKAEASKPLTEPAKVEVKSESASDKPSQVAADASISADDDISMLLEEAPKYTGRFISLDLQDTDIDNALRIIAEVSNLNIIASDDVTGKVTLRLIDVPWDQALDVILKTNGLDQVKEGNVIRIAPVEKLRQEREALKQAIQAEDELEPLAVRYIRISYSKASELKPLVETVITERGTVTHDERTNQLIIKDIRKGIKNVAELVAKVDLRTPQVLLETQIVEAQRSLLRDLGAQVGFNLVQSPATGNATGYNFPNSVSIGGGRGDGSFSSFPSAGASGAFGAAVGLLFESADGTKSLGVALSALEDEGRVRIVSRPAVATTNNKQAIIKSVEKLRVKTPDGGVSVATGSGASAAGGAAVATEVIEIGIVLEVTPQASPDYFVLLDINAKSSTLGATVVDGIPSEVERSATSTVLVSSGQTFAMGGIYKISDSDSVSGVPFFKDIPFLGHLFRRIAVNNRDEELLFFITPRIIEGSFDDATMKVAS